MASWREEQLRRQRAFERAQWAQAAVGTMSGSVIVGTMSGSVILDAGISAGEIIGHRVWRYNSCEHLLQSVAVAHLWPVNGALHVPDIEEHGASGIHAFKSAEAVVNEYNWTNRTGDIALVYGTVALWGTVIEHERGYRGEYARVHSLDSIPQLYRMKELRLLRALRQRYGLS